MLGSDMPADDFSSEEIYDDAEIVVMSVDLHICKITDPYEIWGLLSKSLLQMIYAGAIIVFCPHPLIFNSGHLGQVQVEESPISLRTSLKSFFNQSQL